VRSLYNEDKKRIFFSQDVDGVETEGIEGEVKEEEALEEGTSS